MHIHLTWKGCRARHAAPRRPPLVMWSSSICRRHINKSLRKKRNKVVFLECGKQESDCDTELPRHTNRKQTRAAPRPWLLDVNHVQQQPIKRRYAGAWKDCRSLFGLWASEETLLPQCLSVRLTSSFSTTTQWVSYFKRLMWKCQKNKNIKINMIISVFESNLHKLFKMREIWGEKTSPSAVDIIKGHSELKLLTVISRNPLFIRTSKNLKMFHLCI